MTKARDLANASTALSAVSPTELAYLDGVTSAVQTQIDAKLASATASSTYQPLVSGVSNTEIGYLDGVTSAIQTQIDTKAPSTSPTLVTPVLRSPEERCTVTATAATGTINFDAVTQGVLYYTSAATANWTLNVRGSSGATLDASLATGDAITVVFMNTNTGTAYYANGFQIDGSSVTPKWQNGVAPSSGNVNSIDIYTYTIIKTGSATYTVLASQTKFA